MFLKSLLQLIDAPFAIVVGSVSAVLAIQFGAASLMAQDLAPRRSVDVSVQASADCTQLSQCSAGAGVRPMGACVYEKIAGLDDSAPSAN